MQGEGKGKKNTHHENTQKWFYLTICNQVESKFTRSIPMSSALPISSLDRGGMLCITEHISVNPSPSLGGLVDSTANGHCPCLGKCTWAVSGESYTSVSKETNKEHPVGDCTSPGDFEFLSYPFSVRRHRWFERTESLTHTTQHSIIKREVRKFETLSLIFEALL